MQTNYLSKSFLTFLLVGSILSMASCTGDDNGVSVSSTDISDVKVDRYPTTKVNIDQDRMTVNLIMPDSTDFSHITPTFELSPGVVAYTWEGRKIVNGETTFDLTKPMRIKVVAPDHSSALWTLTADNNGYTSAFGMGNVLTAYRSNDATRSDVYLEQHQSVTMPDDNCGPACAAMVARWADSNLNVTVEDARQFNTANRAWSWTNIRSYLYSVGVYDVSYNYFSPGFVWSDPLDTITEKYGEAVKRVIDSGNIAIQLLTLEDFTYNSENPDYHTNTYYHGYVTHFVVIKGYRIVDGKMYAEVYDPWSIGFKYPDGKYKGENRYYQISDFALMLKNLKISMMMVIGSNYNW